MFIDKIINKKIAVIVLILLVSLIIIGGSVIYIKWTARPSVIPPGGDLYVPIRKETEEAYDKITKTDGVTFPYKDPKGRFVIKYFPGSKMFDVNTKAKTWQEYAERSKAASQFFQSKGVDPCKTLVNFGADPVLLSIPQPKGLDFGCPVSAKP